MKIGIITLPFNTNYGGILQAYALQSALKKMGHEAITINRKTEEMPLKMKVLSFGRRVLLTATGRKNVVIRTWPNKTEDEIISQHTNRFIAENIKTTHLFKSENDFSTLKNQGFEAYVVGSDQVWRPKYSPEIANHFLGFANREKNLKRLSYAASFGVDEWEYNKEQTKNCSELAAQFNAVSVREDSGIKLCTEHLGVQAIRVIDPTLLITKVEYVGLVEKDKIPTFKGTLLNYVLDKAPEKQKIIHQIEDELQLETFSTMPETSFRESGKSKLQQCIFPPVTSWIRGFMDAEFVVTDSFHGTVFSIIFNKPFLAIGNEKRGMSRFVSLLKLFGLEERLVFNNTPEIRQIIRTPIDFEKINDIIEIEKKLATKFLKDALAGYLSGKENIKHE
jgi:hypothetical protein